MLTEVQKEHYRRQIIMTEIGERGQERLLDSKILVIGAGGLGSAVCYYLAAAGIGEIGIIDNDIVVLSNLQRQILHTNNDLGREKVNSAKDKLTLFNPDLKINTYNLKINHQNINELLDGYQIIIAAVDNYSTRFLINEACRNLKKPWIEGAVQSFSGQITTFIPGSANPCYQCLYPERNFLEEKKMGEIGVIGYLAGIIGMLQVNEVIKVILGIGDPLVGKLLRFEALKNQMITINYSKTPECPICSN